jgi:hypothetical protein
MHKIEADHHIDRSIVSYEGVDGQFRGASFWGYGSHARAEDYKEFLESMLHEIEIYKEDYITNASYSNYK